MTGLGVLWLVRDTEGSWAAAGLATGALALAEALVSPQIARLVDRLGQDLALPVLLVVHALSMVVLIMFAQLHEPPTAIVVASLLAGGRYPRSVHVSCALEPLLPDKDQLRTAFALEASANDVSFLFGPPTVIAVGALTTPVAAVAIATALVLAGGVLLAAQRHTMPPPHDAAPGMIMDRRLVNLGFALLLLVNVGLGMFFGAAQLTVTSTATERGHEALAGAFYGLMSAASLVGGLAFGTVRWRTDASRLLPVVAANLVFGSLLLTLLPGLAGLSVSLIVVGLAIAPLIILSATLTERSVAAEALTQAFKWLGSASAAGVAASAAITGTTIDRHGTDAGAWWLVGVLAPTFLTAIFGLHVLPHGGRHRPR